MIILHAPYSLWEGYHESRRCSRDTYLESYTTKYTSIRKQSLKPGAQVVVVMTLLPTSAKRLEEGQTLAVTLLHVPYSLWAVHHESRRC